MDSKNAAWDGEYELPQTLDIICARALDHALNGGHVGLEIASLIQERNFRALVTYELDLNATDWDVFQLIECRQALAFFTKLEPLDAGFDKEQVAYDKFCDTERSCSEINTFFRRARLGVDLSMLPSVVRLLAKARRKVQRVMGRCPSIAELSLKFGPGATTAIKRKDACAESKLAAGFQCSAGLVASGLLPSLLRELPHWVDAYNLGEVDEYLDVAEVEEGWAIYATTTVRVDVVPGKLQFVPKNAKTHRSILVEPVLNGLLQNGIGKWLDKRLRIHGLDIHDQGRNAALARRGSLFGDLATLDLSSASDLIAYELVRELVSDEWFLLLRAARTGVAVYGNTTFQLQKFSSMGNGFTFPLETLIFWAIATSSTEVDFVAGDVGVYGDDIVVPTNIVGDVVWALHAVGFEVNKSKSYISGPFRESCGKDYYKGISTRPYYQKHLVSGATLFNLHNWYKRVYDDVRADAVKALIHPDHLIFGPDGYGDGHLLGDWAPIRKAGWLKKGYGGSAFETFSLKGLRSIARYPGDYVSPLYSIYCKDRVPVHELFPAITETTPVEFGKCGRPFWVRPGSEGYKRVLIYTLA